MVELKTKVINYHGEDGADIETESHMEGIGKDLVHESVALIRAMMQSFKEENIMLYAAVIRELAADPTILHGESQANEHEEFAKMMSEMMSKAIIGKGEPS